MDIEAYSGALKRPHWQLLLQADPWPEAVQAYLPPDEPQAEIFTIGQPHNPYAICVAVPVEGGLEIKNVATRTIMRRQGMASALIVHVVGLARARNLAFVDIGTGETSRDQIRLYEKLGFVRDGVIRGFFSRYPEPIVENGRLCRDMVMLRFDITPLN